MFLDNTLLDQPNFVTCSAKRSKYVCYFNKIVYQIEIITGLKVITLLWEDDFFAERKLKKVASQYDFSTLSCFIDELVS